MYRAMTLETGWLGVVDLDLVSHPIMLLSNALNGSTGLCCHIGITGAVAHMCRVRPCVAC